MAGVTVADALVSGARGRRDRELAEVRLVADAAQKVLLRPVPPRAGPVRFSARYLSASSGAQVGGDLYEVTVTTEYIRLVVGDAEGKGLPALQSASAVLGVFREAAHEEDSLAAIATRIETSLAREAGDEQFVTATEVCRFFSLAGCAAVRPPYRPDTLVDRLSDEIIRHVGHAPHDDVALLLVYRDAA